LDKVEVRFHTAEEKLGPGQLRENQATIDNSASGPSSAEPVVPPAQQIRTYYSFSNVSVDRYWIGGNIARSCWRLGSSPSICPAGRGWVNQHLNTPMATA